MPSKPSGAYSLVEVDRSTKSDAATVKSFKDGQHVRIPVVIVTALIAALGTYFAARHEPAPAQNGLTKDEFEASMRVRDEQLRARLDGIETNVTLLLVRTDRKP